MYNKIYIKYIYSIFLERLLYVFLVFSSLIFIMNILEELKFFSDNDNIGLGYPVLLTVLNLPSVIFEIFPFIILIATQFFFIKFQTNDEILIFRNNGINNLKLISLISFLVFLIGVIVISLFHFLSSNMKNSYLEFKNKYTKDNKYLAVVNENGLWIKDKLDQNFMIIHSEKIENKLLKKLVITTYDNEFRNEKNIIANEALITTNIWVLNDVILIDSSGAKQTKSQLNFETNFDYIKINSLFSNLDSLNVFQLFNQKQDFKSVGLNTSEVDLYLNKIYSLPVSLVIFALLSSLLMLNIKIKRSKTFILISGILLSVVIYYIFYFFGLLGANNKIPIALAVWLPNVILFLSCMVGIININEK